jgi:hypothetical protein
MPSIVSAIPNLYSKKTRRDIVQFLDNDVYDHQTSASNDSTNRFVWIDLPFFREAHLHLEELVSKIFEEPVKPTYTCLSSYWKNTGDLPVHIDREACVYTVSYMIRCDIPSWPIYVSKKELSDDERKHILDTGVGFGQEKSFVNDLRKSTEFIKIDQSPNSAAFFSGTHRWHYREQIPTGTAETILFHYIPLHPEMPRPETEKPPLV